MARNLIVCFVYLCLFASNSVFAEQKILRLSNWESRPSTTDPVQQSSVYEAFVVAQVYESLLRVDNRTASVSLQPVLLEAMPTRALDEQGRVVYRFTLKKGVRFVDDPCFEATQGKGRLLTVQDIFYSYKRMADYSGKVTQGWWVFDGQIVGFDEYKDDQNASESGFDYDVPVDGFVAYEDNPSRFDIVLKKDAKETQFLWFLAHGKTGIVPLECAQYYGSAFAFHPVGTGPFMLTEWSTNHVKFRKNPNYQGVAPRLIDGIDIEYSAATNGPWLEFNAGAYDMFKVPTDYLAQAVNLPRARSRRGVPTLKKTWIDQNRAVRDGSQLKTELTPDFAYYGFNMRSPLVGDVPGDEAQSLRNQYLRQAISLAVDLDEINRSFYSRTRYLYDGPIPFGFDGHPDPDVEEIWPSYRGPELSMARDLLEQAGYPEGRGLPEIDFYAGNGGANSEVVEMLKRQLAEIGVTLVPRLMSFASLSEAVDNGKVTMFAMAWSSDYPDAENNLALFYGPNSAPGSNTFCYQRDETDTLYEEISTTAPSEERTKLIREMRNIIIEDTPFVGSQQRTDFHIVYPWVSGYEPNSFVFDWPAFIDIDLKERKKRLGF